MEWAVGGLGSLDNYSSLYFKLVAMSRMIYTLALLICEAEKTIQCNNRYHEIKKAPYLENSKIESLFTSKDQFHINTTLFLLDSIPLRNYSTASNSRHSNNRSKYKWMFYLLEFNNYFYGGKDHDYLRSWPF